VADEKKKQASDPRERDIEQLAGALYIQLVLSHGASRENAAISREALNKAREFYAVADSQEK
jgi:hypothetical protein